MVNVGRPLPRDAQLGIDPRSAKQCQNCFVPEQLPLKLSTCARCKSVQYCSKECQRAHWPSHRVTCAQNTSARTRALDRDPCDHGISHGGVGYDARTQDKRLKRWIDVYRATIRCIVCEGLDLGRDPERINTHLLDLMVEPTSGVPARDDRTSFTLAHARAPLINDFLASRPPQEAAELRASFDVLRAQAPDIQARAGEPVHLAIVLVHVCGAPLVHISPFGITRAKDLSPASKGWEEYYKEVVAGGEPYRA